MGEIGIRPRFRPKFTHTEVLPQHESEGVGWELPKFVLAQARKRGTHAIPVGQFIAGYIRKHPEYVDLAAPDSRRTFQV